ncbi:hypothetical protein ACHAXH_005256 [Discostella pseudostelligera]
MMSNVSKLTDSTLQAHRLKRKRDDEEEEAAAADDEEDEVIDTTDSLSHRSRMYPQTQSETSSATMDFATLPLPPLREIPGAISALHEMIRHGGCPQCGGIINCHRISKVKVRKDYFSCLDCNHEFCLKNLQSSSNNKNNHRGSNIKTGKQRNTNFPTNVVDEDDHMYQSKLYLKTLVNYAQSEILKKNMRIEHLEFRLHVKNIVAQIKEKRKYVSQCLGISLDDNDDNMMMGNITTIDRRSPISTTMGVASNSKEGVGTVDSEADTDDITTTTIEKDPFQESIRLLKQETRVMEKVMNDLLGLHDDRSGGDSRESLSQSLSSFRELEYSTTRQQHDVTGCEIDTNSYTSNNNVDIVSDNLSSESDNEKYLFASRVLQEDGEEIEIYEKDMNM